MLPWMLTLCLIDFITDLLECHFRYLGKFTNVMLLSCEQLE